MIRSMEEDELKVRGMVGNDPALAAMLVTNHYAGIHRLALAILGDEAEADDAAQETFVRALRGWDGFAPGSNLKGWLATITIRLCRDRLRRRQTRERLRRILEGVHLASPKAPSPEEALIDGEGRQALWTAVQKLNEKHRLVVILRFANGLTVREIAAALEVPEGTVHSRLHHAIKQLGVQMAGWKEALR